MEAERETVRELEQWGQTVGWSQMGEEGEIRGGKGEVAYRGASWGLGLVE